MSSLHIAMALQSGHQGHDERDQQHGGAADANGGVNEMASSKTHSNSPTCCNASGVPRCWQRKIALPSHACSRSQGPARKSRPRRMGHRGLPIGERNAAMGRRVSLRPPVTGASFIPHFPDEWEPKIWETMHSFRPMAPGRTDHAEISGWSGCVDAAETPLTHTLPAQRRMAPAPGSAPPPSPGPARSGSAS